MRKPKSRTVTKPRGVTDKKAFRYGATPLGIHTARRYYLSDSFRIAALQGITIKVKGEIGRTGKFTAIIGYGAENEGWEPGEEVAIKAEDIQDYSFYKKQALKLQKQLKQKEG